MHPACDGVAALPRMMLKTIVWLGQALESVVPRWAAFGTVDRPSNELRRGHLWGELRHEVAVRAGVGERCQRLFVNPH